MPVDLSREAVRARQRAVERGHGHGGRTGAQLLDAARDLLQRANELQRDATTGDNRARRSRARRAAQQALLTAATQIRLAEITPAERGYLHALTIEQIQACERDAARAVNNNTTEQWAALAADTHRRIQRHKREGTR